MSREIDYKIVEAQFQNSSFEKNIKESTHSLDNFKKALNFGNAANGLDSLMSTSSTTAIGQLGNKIDAIGSKFTTLGVVGFTALQRITNAAIDTGVALAKSLSVDQVSAGWSKFGSKTSSVATLVAQGNALEDVNEQLDRLNWFTDETSYNFVDMVSNIAKFTATGKDLKESVTAMEGIANWAALSGQNAATASRAMYQLSQAMGAGIMRKEDYKSIQNASMDTDEFRQKALDAAVALGTLKKNADGTYKSLMATGKGANSFTKSQFAENLTEGLWFTSDVMMKVFNDYSSAVDQIYEYADQKGITASQAIDELGDKVDSFGLKAFKAAQEARTWGDAVDSVKDAVSTGWMNTFELIFGNQKEATRLWTDLANAMYDVFASGGEARNELLADWKNLGGRDELLSGFWNIWDAVGKVVGSIKDGFRDIFPKETALNLVKITRSFSEFTEKMIVSDETADKIRRTFSGLFSILDIGKSILAGLYTGFKNILSALIPVGSGLLDITASLGDFLTALAESIRKSEIFSAIFGTISNVVGKFVSTIQKVISGVDITLPKIDEFSGKLDGLKRIFTSIGKIVDDVFSTISSKIEKMTSRTAALITPENLLGFANIGLLFSIGSEIKNFFSSGSSIFKNIDGMFKGVKSVFKGINELLKGLNSTLEVWQKSKQADTLKTIAIAIAILSASLIGLSMVDPVGLASGLLGITVLFKELIAALATLDKVFNAKSLMKLSQLSIVMVTASAAIVILSTAVKKLGDLKWSELLKGLAGTGALLFMLTESMDTFIGTKKDRFIKGAAGLMALAIAIRILASSVSALGSQNIPTLVKGLASVGAILLELVGFTKFADSFSVFSGVGLIALATSLMIMSSAVKSLGSLDILQLAKGLGGMGVALLEISLAVNHMPWNLISIGIGLIAVSAGLNVMAKALISIGSMQIEEIGKGLLGLGGSLAILVISVNAMKGALLGVAAMVLVANAMNTLSKALERLGSMSLPEIGLALLALVGSIAAFAGAAALLTPVLPAMLALAGVMTLLGVASLGVGIGISALASGLTMLVAMGSTGIKMLVSAAESLIQLIPTILEQFGRGLVALSEIIGDNVPTFVQSGLKLVTGLLDGLTECLPKMIEAGIKLFMGLLGGLRDNIGEMVEMGIDIVINLLNGIMSKLQDVANAAFDIIITFINTIGTTIKDRTPELVEAFVQLGKDVVSGLISGIKSLATGVFDSIKNVGENALETLRQVFDSHSDSKETISIGHDFDNGLATGITDNQDRVGRAVQDTASLAVQKARETMTDGQKEIYNELVDVWTARTRKATAEQKAFLNSQKEYQEKQAEELAKSQKKENDRLRDIWYQRTKDAEALQAATLAKMGKTGEEEGTKVGEKTGTAIVAGAKSTNAGTKIGNTILTDIQTELSKLSTSLTSYGLEQKVWSTVFGDDASDSDKRAVDQQLKLKELENLTAQLNEAEKEYSETVKAYKSDSKEAIEAYNKLLNAQLALAEKSKDIQSSQQTVVENNRSAIREYAKWMAEYKDGLLQMGFSLEEIQRAAQKDTGYDPTIAMGGISDATAAAADAMEKVKQSFANSANDVAGSLTPIYLEYGKKSAEALGEGIQNGTQTIENSTVDVLENTADAASVQTSKFVPVGEVICEKIAEGIDNGSWMVTDKIDAMLSQVSFASGSGATSYANNLSAGLQVINSDVMDNLDTSPTITPVIDDSNVRSGLSTIGSLITGLTPGGRALSLVSKIAGGAVDTANGITTESVTNNYNFNQTNNSPKALTRAEIYRDSKNLMSQLETKTS